MNLKTNVPTTRIGKYELGRILGEGTFGKVRLGRNLGTGQNVAVKVLDKEKILQHKMVEQIKREISTMKMVKHPNIVQLYEVKKGRLREDEARKYFQQLINAVDFCHSRGVYHRDLKPENLLLDAEGNLKISDFGLSALPQQLREDGLLHTTCGTPNYVAPEVINSRGYSGATADLWSCGVILFVLMAGYLPFDETNLMNLYRKIYRAEFKCPSWFTSGARKLILRILHPNPKSRITISKILEIEWFRKGYKPAKFVEEDSKNIKDVEDVFSESEEHLITEKRECKPVVMNAFEIISMSPGLDLSGLFQKQQEPVKQETRFTSIRPAKEIISKIEEIVKRLGFHVHKKNYKMKLLGKTIGRKGHLSISTEIFEVAPCLYMVELSKSDGDTLEYRKFEKSLSTGLKDIVWSTEVNMAESMDGEKQ
ncbi:hypothetical protein O6H91_23G041600 [Diphasiastrum complanatum]|uniref:Uncharacterized protein n=1 Tax=Diphasiastrum complanatum TaxID=34168 RepID=A0ACC2AA40_DIPCM|nr:hypothetical protein O6H91_23G041600 [Diphasiastrum complanatum]